MGRPRSFPGAFERSAVTGLRYSRQRKRRAGLGARPSGVGTVARKRKKAKEKHLPGARLLEQSRRQQWGAKGVDAKGRLIKVSSAPTRCAHGVVTGRCRTCDPARTLWVYITGGGRRWHLFPDCKNLSTGQAKVERRGGTPEPIEAVSARSVSDRGPCKECQARAGGSTQRPIPGRRASAEMGGYVRRDRPIISSKSAPVRRCPSCGQAVQNCLCS